MSKQKLNIHCTICNSPDVDEMVFLSHNAKVMFCNNCKNAFTYPKPKLPDYSSEDFQAGKGEIEILARLEDLPDEIKKSYAIQLAMVDRNLPKGSAVLEIGGGEGIFLDMLKRIGYDVELIEPSVSASLRAKKRELKVQNDYFENKTFDRKYSLICMAHVLEHIDNPLNTINKIKTLLEPRGFILLTQSNFRGFMPFFLKNNWYAWVPDQHFTHFSLAGLRYLATRTSLSVSEYKYSRLVHGPSIYHQVLKYIPFLQDQIHILLQLK
ncbi:MAG TPA: class I SAM-dependent methyltransferase [Puia sp.]|nr:class I SAM-dependent methyltransferase [Puia sp.]